MLGLLAGMIASALQRGSFGWHRPRDVAGWLRHAGGGALMGSGAAMVPGGNDTLLLGSLPAMTASALLSYLSMLAGVALALGTLRATRMPMPILTCSPAGCEDPGSTAREP